LVSWLSLFLWLSVFSLLTFVWLWCGFGFLAFWFLSFLVSCFGLFSLNFLALVVPAYTLFQVRQEQINMQNAKKHTKARHHKVVSSPFLLPKKHTKDEQRKQRSTFQPFHQEPEHVATRSCAMLLLCKEQGERSKEQQTR